MGIRDWLIRRAEEKTELIFSRMSTEEKEVWDKLVLHGTEKEKQLFVSEIIRIHQKGHDIPSPAKRQYPSLVRLEAEAKRMDEELRMVWRGNVGKGPLVHAESFEELLKAMKKEYPKSDRSKYKIQQREGNRWSYRTTVQEQLERIEEERKSPLREVDESLAKGDDYDDEWDELDDQDDEWDDLLDSADSDDTSGADVLIRPYDMLADMLTSVLTASSDVLEALETERWYSVEPLTARGRDWIRRRVGDEEYLIASFRLDEVVRDVEAAGLKANVRFDTTA